MKIDLTNLPENEQTRLAILYIGERIAISRGKPTTIFATDLMDKFKHRGAGEGAQRRKFFSGLLSAAQKQIATARSIPPQNPS